MGRGLCLRARRTARDGPGAGKIVAGARAVLRVDRARYGVDSHHSGGRVAGPGSGMAGGRAVVEIAPDEGTFLRPADGFRLRVQGPAVGRVAEYVARHGHR